MEFKLWSEINFEARKALMPDMGFRSWDELSDNDKFRIWNHLEIHFFNPNQDFDYENHFQVYTDNSKHYYPFYEPDADNKRKRINYAVAYMHDVYKVNNYAKNLLHERTHYNACADFRSIFMTESENIVFELISLYCKALIDEFDKKFYRVKDPYEKEESYEKERQKWKDGNFNDFADELNNVFSDFGLKVHMTKNGFIPRQDEKIITEIFEPVLKCLSGDKWREVNNILKDAFDEYRKNTKNGFSSCVTHTVAAVQAFLQILIYGKTGKGDISKLIIQGQKENLIPKDTFTREIFKTIESVLMSERQNTGHAHPKKEYASEKNAKMLLNLSMVFIQHCLLN
jgi:hypothetical protein